MAIRLTQPHDPSGTGEVVTMTVPQFATLLNGSKTLTVDAVLGSNQTASRGGTPYSTLTAAKNAAQSGDLIVVNPGTYSENDLLKDGVHWHFQQGSVVDYKQTVVGPGYGLFDDRATGAVSCKITGQGIFRYQNIRETELAYDADHGTYSNYNLNDQGMINIENSGTTIHFQALELINNTYYAGRSTIRIRNCAHAFFDINYIHQDGATLTFVDPNFPDPEFWGTLDPVGYAIQWVLGPTYINVKKIVMFSYCLWCDLSTAGLGSGNTGDIYMNCDHAETSNGAALYWSAPSGNPNWRTWYRGGQVITGGVPCNSLGGGKVYLDVLKLSGLNNPANIIQIDNGDGILWLRAQKITAACSGAAINIGSGANAPTAYIDVAHIEYAGGGAINCGGAAKVYVKGGVFECSISHSSSGKMVLMGCRIDATFIGASANPISVTTSTLILQNCVLVSGSGNSITAGSAKNVAIHGSVAATIAKHANITIIGGGTLVVDAGVV